MMKGKFKHTEKRGLPGGPNEQFTYVTGVFSTEGYKRNSPDVNNPFNIIPSGNITMNGVDFPVLGIDNLGNSQMMFPGNDYQFPGNQVLEIPTAQRGGNVKIFTPDEGIKYVNINSPEYYQLYNSGKLASYDENTDTYYPPVFDEVTVKPNRTRLSDELRSIAKPIGNLAFELTGLPGALRFIDNPKKSLTNLGMMLERGIVGSSPFISSGVVGYKPKQSTPEEIASAFDAVDMLGWASTFAAPFKIPVQKGLQQAGKYLTQGPLKNAYTINPFAGKLGRYNRVIDEGAVLDAQTSGVIRAKAPADKINDTRVVNLDRRGTTPFPSFGEGPPLQRYADLIINRGNTPFFISTNRPMRVSTLGRHGLGSTMFPVDKSGKYLKEFPAGEAQIFEYQPQPHWWKGYKPINTPKAQKGKEYNDATYAKARQEGRLYGLDPTTGDYYAPTLREAMIRPDIANKIYQGQNKFLSGALDVMSAPQKSMVELMTGKYQSPSEAMKITNPIASFLTDAVLDPTNLLGAGLVKRGVSFVKPNLLRSSINNIPIRPTDLLRPTSLNNTFNLEELRRVYHNSKRILTPQELRFLDKHGRGLRENYISDMSNFGWGTDQWNPNNQLPPIPSQLEINFPSVNRPNRIVPTRMTPEQIEAMMGPIDLRRSINGHASGTPEWNRLNDIINKLRASTHKPKSVNKSGITKEEALARASAKDKDAISKMSEDEFSNTVLKPTGEIVSYKPGPSIDQITYDLNTRQMVLKDQVQMSAKEYADEFNSKLDILNDIIAQRNKSGVEYRVKGLDENGRLTFYTPQQSIKHGYVNLPIPSGESSWEVTINPGQWRGNVEDIANTEYFRSIPGLEMRNTTSGVFADHLPRKGTGAYESINEYLKRLDLGRVKPGFNSQTNFSRGAWENFIKSGRGVGFYANPSTIYGTMKSVFPYIGAGYLGYKGLQGAGALQEKSQYQTAGEFPINITQQDNTRRVAFEHMLPNQQLQPVKTSQANEDISSFIEPKMRGNITERNTTFVAPVIVPKMHWSTEDVKNEQSISNKNYVRPNVTGNFTNNVYIAQKEKERLEKISLKDYTKAPSKEIKELQSQLLQEGYSVGWTGVDGKYGNNTRNAYKAKVEDDALDLSAVDRYYGKYKTQGSDKRVVEIQKDLVRAGFMKPNQIDGKFGDITKTALENYNKGFQEDTKAVVFNNPPSKIKDTRCAAGMCKILEAQDIPTRELGMKFTNAWDMLENMNKAGNSKTVYNIYDNQQFKNVKNTAELKAATNRVKKFSQTTADMYQIGDIVGLYYPPSSHHSETLKSKTHNTHVGWVQEIVNGVPIIAHNIKGQVYQQPYTELITAWIQRPNESMLALSDAWKGTPLRYNPSDEVDYDTQPIIANFEKKIERPLNPNERQIVNNVITRAHITANNLTKELESLVDPKWVEQTVFGISGVESAAGINAPRSRDDMSAARRATHFAKGTDDAKISFGVGKIKYSSLDPFSREYFQINTPSDLANDNKNVDVIAYNLIKAYETFKDYSNKFPELGLTEQDIRNMSILAHNQGFDRLLKTGRSDTKKNLSPQEEVDLLRSLYLGTIKDVTSTNYKYAGRLGKILYNSFEEGSETYISKVNRYANEIYNSKPKTKATTNTSNLKQPTGMMKGGEFTVYKDYVNGLYEGTPKESWAEKTYDKLNRVYYKDAKDAGMSVPNYIMTKVFTLQ